MESIAPRRRAGARRAGRHRWLRRLWVAPEIGLLTAVYAVAAVVLVLGSLYPLAPNAPVMLMRWVAGGSLLAAGGLIVFGARLRRGGLHAAVGTITVVASVLISQSVTNGGMMLVAWAYAWIGIYAAFFFERREIYAHASLVTVGSVAGMAIAQVPRTIIAAVVVNLTMWAGAVAFGTLAERLREQADTDPLTGLLNRNAFKRAATREIALAWRTGNPLAMAVLDLDGFKRVNDAEGHAAGDRLLAELARAWEGTLRPGDILARHGGDEFVVLFPATTGPDARAALERLAGAHPGRWSAGVAVWERGEPLGACLARADARLYEAKAAGGGIALADALAPARA